tara:strand:+ start:3051 stop:3236 length:186 start_codon:yes stop_codon:yes gene_type:complete
MSNNLTNEELMLIANIINISSKNGTFGAREMAEIGILWNKIMKNLDTKKAETQVPKNIQKQ